MTIFSFRLLGIRVSQKVMLRDNFFILCYKRNDKSTNWMLHYILECSLTTLRNHYLKSGGLSKMYSTSTNQIKTGTAIICHSWNAPCYPQIPNNCHSMKSGKNTKKLYPLHGIFSFRFVSGVATNSQSQVHNMGVSHIQYHADGMINSTQPINHFIRTNTMVPSQMVLELQSPGDTTGSEWDSNIKPPSYDNMVQHSTI